MVFSDMVMPVMGGDQLAEEIKELNPNIKILLTSGYTDSQLMKTGLLSRGYHFYTNLTPFNKWPKSESHSGQ